MILDLVLASCKVVDGSGNPWFWGDVGIQDGRIVRIGPAGALQGARVIDVDGRYVTPGFIDVHTHSDLSILINRPAESVVRQGVTTELVGNCGMSAAPFDDESLDSVRSYWGGMSAAPELSWEWRSMGCYLDEMRRGGVAINIGALVGHGTLRLVTMGYAERSPTPAELERMRSLADAAMQEGAFGLSTGLVYPPGCFAATDEIVALCQVVARHGGFYASHVRGERETILEAVAEAIDIGRRAGVPVQISHNCPKYGAPCDATGNLGLVEAARAEGLEVTVDNDVHTDLGPPLIHGLPQSICERPVDEVRALLSDPAQRARTRGEIVDDARPAFGPAGLLRHGRWDRITLLRAPNSPALVGRTIAEIAQERAADPFDVYFDIIVESGSQAEAIFDYVRPEDIELLLQHPCMMISSDGSVSAPYGFLGQTPEYNPCSYGEYPGILERYVRDRSVLRLEEAIRKMTMFPAQRMGLWDRGYIRPGARADLVILDLERVRDRATNLYPHSFPFENVPHQYPEGIDHVLVNGALVVDDGEHTGTLPGQVLRHRARLRAHD